MSVPIAKLPMGIDNDQCPNPLMLTVGVLGVIDVEVYTATPIPANRPPSMPGDVSHIRNRRKDLIEISAVWKRAYQGNGLHSQR